VSPKPTATRSTPVKKQPALSRPPPQLSLGGHPGTVEGRDSAWIRRFVRRVRRPAWNPSTEKRSRHRRAP
jgi:hypothetical protein